MASGSFKKGWGQYTKDYELIVDWSSTSTISSNSSVVTVTVRFYCPYTCNMGKRYNNTITINGVSYDFTSPAINTSGGTTHTLAQVTSGAIAHNADGSKSISISANFRFNASLSGVQYGNQTASKTVALDNIPRAATITGAPNFNDEANPTITYNNSAGNSVSSLRACISLDGSKDDIAYRDISKTGTSYTFNLTTAERNVLRNATTTSKTRTVRFYIETVIGGNTYRNNLSKTLTIVNANPTVSPTATDTGSHSITLTGDASGKVIKGYNSMSVNIGATALKGATLKSYNISSGGKSITTASGKLNNIESGSITFTVTDSRGNKTTKTLSKSLINYVKPTCTLTVPAPSTDGNVTFTIKGNYYNGTFGAVSNALTVQYRYKTNSGSYGSWTNATATISGNTYSSKVSLTGLNYLNSYTFQARVGDKIYNGTNEAYITSPEKKVKTTPIFDWGENDFKFNVPVAMANGKPLQGVSGSGENVNLAYITTNTSNLQIGGGAYAPTNIFINTKDNAGTVSINGKAYGVNRVLWEGSYYMTEGHTVTLSETVSSQITGIVLVFSRYDIEAGSSMNEHFSTHFVPKQLVALQEGKGMVFNMNTVSHSYSASKYLYIYDKEIKGNSNNVSVAVGNDGVSYNNNRFVLRYVIGV